MKEQSLEKYWFESMNRKVAEKRREEELHEQVKEWSEAKERLSVEITRKQENQIQGTKFEKARGYVRKNYSSKRFNPNHNPLLEDTSSSEEEQVVSKVTGKPPLGARDSRLKSTRFEEEDDDYVIEDDGEAND